MKRATVIPTLVVTSLVLLASAPRAQIDPYQGNTAPHPEDNKSLDKDLDSIKSLFYPGPKWGYKDTAILFQGRAMWTISERNGCSESFVQDYLLIGRHLTPDLNVDSSSVDEVLTTVIVPLDQIDKIHIDKRSYGTSFEANGKLKDPTFPAVVLEAKQGVVIPFRFSRSTDLNGKSLPVQDRSDTGRSVSFEFADLAAADKAAKTFQHAVALCRVSARKSRKDK